MPCSFGHDSLRNSTSTRKFLRCPRISTPNSRKASRACSALTYFRTLFSAKSASPCSAAAASRTSCSCTSSVPKGVPLASCIFRKIERRPCVICVCAVKMKNAALCFDMSKLRLTTKLAHIQSATAHTTPTARSRSPYAISRSTCRLVRVETTRVQPVANTLTFYT